MYGTRVLRQNRAVRSVAAYLFIALYTLVAGPPVLLLAALAAAGIAAQQEEEPAARFGERIQVTEVLLDVLVTDARGNVIVGLDKDDFIVEEGDRQVPLTAATFYGSHSILRSPAIARRLGAGGSSDRKSTRLNSSHSSVSRMPSSA